MIQTLTLLALTLGAAPPHDEGTIPHELSLHAAEEIFLARGLDLLVAEAAAQGAEGDQRAAAAHPNPNLGLTFVYGPTTHKDLVGGDLNASPGVTGQLHQTLGFNATLGDNFLVEDQLSGKRSLRIEATSRALAAARIGVEDVKRLELSQLRQAYVSAVLAKLNMEAAKETLATYDRQLKLNQIKFDKGAISGLDVSRIQQADLEAQQSLDQAVAGYRQSVASLLFLLGVRDGFVDVELTTGIGFTSLPKLEQALPSALLSHALAARTDVRMALETVAQKRALLEQAKRARVPDIGLNVGYGEQCNSATCSSAPTLSAGVSGNLPLLYQQQGEIRRAASDLLAAQRNLDKARAQVLSDVTQALVGYETARKLVTRMESQLIAQAKRSRDLAQLLYSKGAASLLDFLDAERAYVAANLEYHQDLANYWTAVYQMEQATSSPWN